MGPVVVRLEAVPAAKVKGEAERSGESRLRFCRVADQMLDIIELSDPAAYQLVTATLHAAVARPTRVPVLPLRCRRALDGRALALVQAGPHGIVLAVEPSSASVDVVAILLSLQDPSSRIFSAPARTARAGRGRTDHALPDPRTLPRR
jgi:hypothetical protein